MSKPSRLNALLLGILIPTLSAAETSPVVGEDRVGFPEGYAQKFAVLRTVLRDDGAKRVTVYGNPAAAGLTNRAQLPYPNGSILVMETASTVKGDDGKPVKDGDGQPKKDQVLGLHVMRRGAGFGAGYGEKRSGEWEYAEYRADRSYITTPANSAACAECHIKAGAEKDFVYNGRFAEPVKKPAP